MRWRRLAIAAAAVLAAGLPAASAHARETLQVRLSRRYVAPGGQLAVSAAGFPSAAYVNLFLDQRFLRKAEVNADGTLTGLPLVIPSSTRPGLHKVVVATTGGGTVVAWRRVHVSVPWSTYAGGLARTGDNERETLIDERSVEGLHVVWRRPLPGVRDPVNASESVAIAGGSLFTSTCNGNLVAIRRGSGRMRWQTQLPGEAPYAVTVRGRFVYAAWEDGFGAFDRHSGALRWSHRETFPGSPAVTRTLALVAASGRVEAYDRRTGELRWLMTIGGMLTTGQYTTPAVARGVVYVAGPASVTAIALVNGGADVIWQHDLGGDPTSERNVSTPLLYGGRVYVSTGDGNLVALDGSTGAEIWSDALSSTWQRPPNALTNLALSDGLLFVGAADAPGPTLDEQSARVIAVSAADGEVRWSHLVSTRFFEYGTPVVANGLVFDTTQSGRLFALDAQTGDLRWRSPRLGPIADVIPGSQVVVSDGHVYLGLDNLSVVALGLPAR
ncbi:MAG TPA: PQQ-binding-like beta-propeller repeat protein [Gaiellales bacterium]|nr:PQQ-binding-like beta-propeller repeat protein [Gaiellales bacterium]